jgi:hypothetical protein
MVKSKSAQDGTRLRMTPRLMAACDAWHSIAEHQVPERAPHTCPVCGLRWTSALLTWQPFAP